MQNFPSISSIEVSGILSNAKRDDAATELRRLIKHVGPTADAIRSEDYPSVAAMRRDYYHSPTRQQVKLAAISDLLGGHGVETCETASGGEWLEYVNLGDSYAVTVIYWRKRYYLASLGDFLETSGKTFR